ncbi:hypothetical protein RHGRI_020430 [Rhododendron griersonianum]|uniref:Pectinesterase inhibitor domain-containing protein n=1 Tax=Rhododendron griersonianum TaxID=479676 RepID=A0AAV6JLK0_9ERIC|nr:hypothetical protein RHGRI_020430 [Rhododendron griersonianum]
MHLSVRGMPLLFSSVLFTLTYCSLADLIADTCKKTEYLDFCISTLRSNPDSKAADVEGLVNDLLRKTEDRGLKQSLAICVSLYGDAVNFDIPRAIQSVGKDNFTARTGTNALF